MFTSDTIGELYTMYAGKYEHFANIVSSSCYYSPIKDKLCIYSIISFSSMYYLGVVFTQLRFGFVP